MKYLELMKRICKLLGSTNFQNEIAEAIIIAKVKKDKYVMNYIASVVLFIVILVCLSIILSPRLRVSLEYLFFFILGILFLGLLSVIIRLKEGDTIILNDKGIQEDNWLYSKFIAWDDVRSINVYSEGTLSKKYFKLRPFKFTSNVITVIGKINNIKINNKYSNIELIQAHLSKNYSGIIKYHRTEPIVIELIIFIIMISLLILAGSSSYFSNLIQIFESITK